MVFKIWRCGNGSEVERPAGAISWRHPNQLLILVSVLALLPRLFDGLLRPIDYNGFWHIFIARNLPREWPKLPHPPLFLVFLRVIDSFSNAVLAYRSVSLLTGVVAVYLVGRILLRLETLPVVAILAALTMAFASNAITLSNEVQSYSLCVLFILGSFFFYLDLLRTDSPPSKCSRVAFASLACLGLLSHYFTGLYLIACVLAPLVVVAVRQEHRHSLLGRISRRWRADLLTILPPGLVGFLLYEFQAKRFVQPLNELPGFYFEAGMETVSSFLIRNLRNTFNLFAPVVLPRARYALPLLALFALVVFWAAGTEKKRGLGSVNRLLPALFLILLLVTGMALGVLGWYPLGGWMRQQFLIFVFGVLGAFVALDRLLRALRSRVRRNALVALCFGLIGVNFAKNFDQLAHPPPEAFLPKVEAFSEQFPGARTVHVDQFSLVGLFIAYHDWEWRFSGQDPGNKFVESYSLNSGDRRLTITAYRDSWIFDFSSEALFREYGGVWGKSADACEYLLCVGRTVYKPVKKYLAVSEQKELREGISSGMAAEGLEARRVIVTTNGDVYAESCVKREVRVTKVVPGGTAAGVPFQIQPRGDSAISVLGSGFRRGAAVVLDGHRLETTFGNIGWVTASVPRDLYARPGRLELRVVNADRSASNAMVFEVHP